MKAVVLAVLAATLLVLGCGDGLGNDPGSGGGGGALGGGSGGGGGAGGGGGGGETTSNTCSNGVDVGQSVCPFGGKTLEACSRRPSGVLVSYTQTCGGSTPTCASEVVNGVHYSACCSLMNIDNPRASDCASHP